MFLKYEGSTNSIESYKIIDNDMEIGGLDIEKQPKIDSIYLENIIIDKQFRGKGYLRKTINELKKFGFSRIGCLPLPEHIDKFKHIGFKFHFTLGDDTFYILNV